MNHKVLIVDDEQHILKTFQDRLADHDSINPIFADTAREAIKLVKASPLDFAVIVLDFHFEDEKINGAEVAKELFKINPQLFILIFTGDETAQTPIDCLRAGVNDFIRKGQNLDEAITKIQDYCIKFDETRRVYMPEMDSTKKYLKNEELIKKIGMIGRSDDLADVAKQIIKVSETNSNETILIRGESGTGKELVAKALHDLSERHNHKMVKINCGSIPANLLESELFGHEKGAFTGADNKKIGKFHVANKGTIFLDEIGDMPAELQVKLLRVLQEGTIEPIGSNNTIQVDIRVIAATHINLENAVKEGKFREDLYYRLNVIPIRLTPLRTRREDIEPLIMFFQEKHKIGLEKKFLYKTILYLKSFNWKGNVRELENTVRRLLVLSDSDVITLDQLEGKFFNFNPKEINDFNRDYSTFKNDLEQIIVKKEKAFFEFHYAKIGSMRGISKKLSIPYTTLRLKFKELNIAEQ